jgi:hypothetical protein
MTRIAGILVGFTSIRILGTSQEENASRGY